MSCRGEGWPNVRKEDYSGPFCSTKSFTTATLGARCRINKDTEAKSQEAAAEAHCLKTQDSVVHGKNHEPIDSRRGNSGHPLESYALSLSSGNRGIPIRPYFVQSLPSATI